MTYSAIPKWTITDTNGDPVVAGTIYFYEEGTTTPKNVYSDAARSVSAGSELTTDGYGQIGPVYLDTEAPTKIVAKDDADATLWTIDSLTPPGGATGVAGGGGASRATSPLDYGAVGDGAADETTEVQAAIDAATGEVDLAGKTYRCDLALTWPEGIKIKNGTIDFSAATALNLLSCQGSLGASVALTANAAIGDTYVDITDTTGFAAGDWIILGSTADWSASAKDGELVRIQTVSSGTRLALESNVDDAYLTSQGAFVKKLTTVKRGILEDVRIIGAYASTQYAVYVAYGDGFEFRNVTIEGFHTAGVRIWRSANARFDGCTFRDVSNGSGIIVQSAANSISITDSEFALCSTGIDVGNNVDYIARGVSISGCTFRGSFVDAISFAPNSQYCSAIGNKIFGATSSNDSGISDAGSDNLIQSNIITDVFDYGVSLAPARTKAVAIGADTYGPMSMKCIGNIIRSGTAGIKFSAAGSSFAVLAGVRIDNNTVDNATTGIDFDSARSIDALSVCGNQFDYIGGTAIDIAHTGTSKRMRVARNVIRECKSGSGIIINADNDFDVCRIDENEIDEFGTYGIHVNLATAKTGTRLRITRNECVTTQASSEAILVEPTDAGSLSEVDILNNYCVANNPTRVIAVLDPYRVRIRGNVARGTGATSGAIAAITNDTTVATLGDIDISDNPSIEGSTLGVNIQALNTNNIDNVSVNNNTSKAVIALYVFAATGQTISGVTISNNRLTGTGASGTLVLSSTDDDGIIHSAVSGNVVTGTSSAMRFGRCKRLAVSGNTLYSDSTGATALEVLNADKPTNAVLANNVVVNDETVDTNESCIAVTGAACSDVLVSGNQTDGGYYGIKHSVSSPTKLMVDGNLSTNYGSAALNGTWTLGVSSTTNTDFKTGY